MDLVNAHTSQHLPAMAFQHAHDFIIQNPIIVNSSEEQDTFMEKFAEATMQGAELDSSERDPPPRCHPGTRIELIERLRLWISDPQHRTKNVLWVVGPAGVGKSAIIQTVAELELESNTSRVLAALFFSALNRRNNPSKVVATLSYQIALKHPSYRQYLRSKLKTDPKLWHKSIITQFAEFIVHPFVKRRLYQDSGRILIFIDGLDDQRFPDAPLLWIIASRPEAHITEHLARKRLKDSFEKVDVVVNSIEACRDTEHYLRAEFEKMRKSNVVMLFYPRWPPEDSFLKIAAAASGLFAYATTAVRFIGDSRAGDPISNFQLIVALVDQVCPPNGARPSSDQPMRQLDKLYLHILSRVSDTDLPCTREVLAAMILDIPMLAHVRHITSALCEWLCLAPNRLYSALRQLHAVLDIPPPSYACSSIKVYHKSFSDFLLDSRRSGLFLGTVEDEKHRNFLRALRVLKEVPYCHLPHSNSQYKRCQLGNIRLSWVYDGLEDEFSARNSLHLTASAFFRSFLDSKTSPEPDVISVLEVTPVIVWWESIRWLYDNEAAMQHLRRDRVLLDLPARLLEIENIDPCEDSRIWVMETHRPVYSVMLYGSLHWNLVDQVKNYSDRLLTCFIGNHLRGWVEIPVGSAKNFITYDFAHLRDQLKVYRAMA
ncbi:hypothetical protein NP233_g12995 [Leucocoprinus birnbaumii]|uniref:Nephrocystin 3-like N-terminal domain-containing protein n=1 Tax=Leucocoprinus birnbaumii TaxID=56174 RepID=A0AAD5VFG1_9AGAR|nr:hypothetical protein NP233_g12995 [Leucocoprinus birnbaumii]